MNKDDTLSYLVRYLCGFLYHEGLIEELLKIIAVSGAELQFFKLLLVRLRQLSSLGIHAVKLREFEKIGSGLYSMHFAGTNFNIRILYAFMPDDRPVLLIPFYERAGKRKTDYTPYIEPALSRFAELKEEYENGFKK